MKKDTRFSFNFWFSTRSLLSKKMYFDLPMFLNFKQKYHVEFLTSSMYAIYVKMITLM